MPWESLASEWLRGRVKRGEIVPLTARNYRSSLSSLCTVIGNRAPAQVGRSLIEDWVERRHTSGISPATRQGDWTAARGWCSWLVERGVLGRDPTAGIPGPRSKDYEPRALDLDQVEDLLAMPMDARLRAIVLIQLWGGLRCCEVETLTIERWSRRDETFHVIGKGGHERYVPVHWHVRDAIDTYLAEHPTTAGPIIRNYRTGKALRADTISGMVSALMDGAGIKNHPRDGISAHALRHTAASDTLDACGDVHLVQEFLGHRRLTTTARYLRRAGIAKIRAAMDQRNYPVGAPQVA